MPWIPLKYTSYCWNTHFISLHLSQWKRPLKFQWRKQPRLSENLSILSFKTTTTSPQPPFSLLSLSRLAFSSHKLMSPSPLQLSCQPYTIAWAFSLMLQASLLQNSSPFSTSRFLKQSFPPSLHFLSPSPSCSSQKQLQFKLSIKTNQLWHRLRFHQY